ncbi:hypothetical protein A9264_03140 [Vibrio sp. UCD-FRSSP16_10]|nr:hypothetical protein A9260_04590 [Vibrio sp. UCD-FRSSP16_30]OBT20479.1 hypothetical protein A9264_03140 [Vibrio sp. UCD-FRSSP16_10]
MKFTVVYLRYNKLILIRIILLLFMVLFGYQLYNAIVTGVTPNRDKYEAWDLGYIGFVLKYSSFVFVSCYFLIFGFRNK